MLGHSPKINVLNFIRLLVSLLGHSHTCKINVLNFIRLLASLLGHPYEIKVLNFIIFLNPRVGKINRILCFVSLAERAKWVHRRRGSRQKTFSLWPYNKSFIDQACSVMMTSFRSIKTQRRIWPVSRHLDPLTFGS